jgi:hypothetical protein
VQFVELEDIFNLIEMEIMYNFTLMAADHVECPMVELAAMIKRRKKESRSMECVEIFRYLRSKQITVIRSKF